MTAKGEEFTLLCRVRCLPSFVWFSSAPSFGWCCVSSFLAEELTLITTMKSVLSFSKNTFPMLRKFTSTITVTFVMVKLLFFS